MLTTTDRQDNVAESLLLGGVVLAPLFYVTATVQMVIRDGFDLTRHAISSLSLGDLGWIQIANFVITGTLAILLAVGMRRVLRDGPAGTWAPLLVGLYGVGIIVAGLFPPDAALGFPVGTPDALPESLSRSAQLHAVGFFAAFGSLTAVCFVVARQFFADGARGWGLYSVASGVVAPLLVFLGTAVLTRSPGVCFALAGAVGFGWLSAVAARLRADLRSRRHRPTPGSSDVAAEARVTNLRS